MVTPNFPLIKFSLVNLKGDVIILSTQTNLTRCRVLSYIVGHFLIKKGNLSSLQVLLKCFSNALGVLWECSWNALPMLLECSWNALGMLLECSSNALGMLFECSLNALRMLFKCSFSFDGLWVLMKCSPSAPVFGLNYSYVTRSLFLFLKGEVRLG